MPPAPAGKVFLTTVALGIVTALVAVSDASSGEAATPPAVPPVIIDYFFEPGCEECFRVTSEVIPVLQARYAGFYVLHKWDTGLEEHYLKLAAYMDQQGVQDNAAVFMVIDGQDVLAGFEVIAERLFSLMDERLAARLEDAAAVPVTAAGSPPAGRELVAQRIERFTLTGVLVGGLIDGINPCAIATLVFLISVLSMSRVNGWNLLLVGVAFCLASLLTYTAIGFGVLRALHALACFQTVRTSVDFILVAVLTVFAVYSFCDAFRYRQTRMTKDVTLQLPAKVKQTIHRIVRVGLGKKAQVTWAFAIGAAVTALESVCTGQIYVPTLALVVKSGTAVTRGLSYLVLYNLMFILPLVVVFLLTYRGLKLTRLIEWSVRNVFVSKLLMGGFFLALAAAILSMD